jgi:hypothetical protein
LELEDALEYAVSKCTTKSVRFLKISTTVFFLVFLSIVSPFFLLLGTVETSELVKEQAIKKRQMDRMEQPRTRELTTKINNT